MKKCLFLLSVLGVTLAGCQMKSDTVDAKIKTDTVIVLSCKNSINATTVWQISLKGNLVRYDALGKSSSHELSATELEEMGNLLVKNKTHKIKTKTVAENRSTNWVSVSIVHPQCAVRCLESYNYKLTKKSRKKVEIIRNYVLSLLNTPLDSENDLVLAD